MASDQFWVERACKHCGTVFRRRRCRVGRPGFTGEYCSRGCATLHRSIGLQDRVCAVCGASFQVKPAELKVYPSLYCSNACWGIAHRRRVMRTCETCGKEFSRPRSYLKNSPNAGRFCCWACYRVATVGLPTRNFYGYAWRKIAMDVRRRDGYRCTECGKEQRKPALHVHHVVDRREFGGDVERADDFSNLRSLCSSCHARVTVHRYLEGQ